MEELICDVQAKLRGVQPNVRSGENYKDAIVRLTIEELACRGFDHKLRLIALSNDFKEDR